MTIIEQQQHGIFLRPVAIAIQFEINIYTFYAQWQYQKTVPIKAKLYAQWMSSGYINTVPRNMNPYAQWLSDCIRPVALRSLKL